MSWLALTDLASRRYGVVTRAQAATLFTRRQFEGRAKRGHLLPAARGVWLVAGAPRIWRQRVMVACLAVGPPVAVSHASAARLWALDGIAPVGTVHVVVPPKRSGRGVGGAIVHRSPLAAAEIVERWGIPVTVVSRTLADIAGLVTTEVLSRATDDAQRRRLIRPADLGRLRRERRHTAGVANLDRVLDDRVGPAAGDSILEDRLYRWIVGAGLPAPIRQYQVVLPEGIAILDMAYPDHRIAIEFDGWEWHAGRRRFDQDRVRSSELAIAGWTTIVVTASQSEAEVTNRIRRALITAGWRPT
jgi:hypothetical protein